MRIAAKTLMLSAVIGGLAAAGCGEPAGPPRGSSASSSKGSGSTDGNDSDGSGSASDDSGVATCSFPARVTSCDWSIDPDTNASDDIGPSDESLLSDFSPRTWQNTAGKFGQCPASSYIGGAVQSYHGAKTGDSGTRTSLSNAPDLMAQNMVFVGKVAAGDYAGGILAFGQCLNTSKYTGVKFKLGGDIGGCDLILQIQTLSQQSDEYGGECDHTAHTCYQFPNRAISFDTSAPITVAFADLAGTGIPSSVDDFEKEIIGIQWQLQAAQADCLNITMTLDDVSLVMD